MNMRLELRNRGRLAYVARFVFNCQSNDVFFMGKQQYAVCGHKCARMPICGDGRPAQIVPITSFPVKDSAVLMRCVTSASRTLWRLDPL